MFQNQARIKPGRQNLDDYQQDLYDRMGTMILHPLGISIFALMTLWTFLAPRRYVLWALLFIACLVSPAQRFAFFSIDFHFQRAIAVVILIRILFMGEIQGIKLRNIDYAVFVGAFCTVVFSGIGQNGVYFVPILGRTLDGISIYLIARAYVRNLDDLRTVLLGAAIVAVPVMIGFIIEKSTRYNIFSTFGGVPEITAIRDGKLRAQGAFTHPIIAGVFWVVFMGMFFGVLLAKIRTIRDFIIGWIGTISAALAALMTASSTPIAGLLIVLVGWCTFPLRAHLRAIRWTILFVAVFLHVLSRNGIHALLFTKISFITASTGHWRYMLIDGMIDSFSQWALIGKRDANFNYAFRDITNDYIATALHGGVITLVLKIAAIAFAFAAIGRVIRAAQNRADLLLAYGLGVGLLTVILSMLSVSMFLQGEIPVYLTLGMAASLGDPSWLQNTRIMRSSIAANKT